jgi:tellurite resistance protein TerC
MIWLYAGFIAFVLLMLTLDLGVFHRKAHVVSVREALGWSAMWITLGLSFVVFIYFSYRGQWFGLGTEPDPADGLVNSGWTATQKYLTGYVIEESLSVDNIFVIAMMFGYFGVPAMYRYRVLFWGIIGAVVMRGTMIALGTKLIAEFHWVLYAFGVFLILTAIRMMVMKSDEKDPTKNLVVRLARRFFPITAWFHGEHFLVRAGTQASHESRQTGVPAMLDAVVDRAKPGTLLLTPLALALVVIESTDVVFAVDSIPAIFAITADPFLVFTSNVFAILGLRSLYFALAGMVDKFRYLKVSLSMVLAVVGVKMLTAKWLKAAIGEHFNLYLLVVVFLILAAGVVASLIAGGRQSLRSATGPGTSQCPD